MYKTVPVTQSMQGTHLQRQLPGRWSILDLLDGVMYLTLPMPLTHRLQTVGQAVCCSFSVTNTSSAIGDPSHALTPLMKCTAQHGMSAEYSQPQQHNEELLCVRLAL